MGRRWKERGLPLVASLAIVLLVFAGVRTARDAGLLTSAEAAVFNHWVRQLPKAKDSQCVIVGVSEDDIHAWNQYPISDKKMAALLNRLFEMQPRVIGIDIYRDIDTPDLSTKGHDDGRERLAKALLNDSPPVVSGYLLDTFGTGVPPPPELKNEPGDIGFTPERIGFVNVDTSDPDEIRRRGLLYMADPAKPDGVKFGLAMRLVERYFVDDDAAIERLNTLPPARADDLFYAGRVAPVSATAAGSRMKASTAPRPSLIGQSVLLDFHGPAAFPRYDVETVLADDFDPAAVRDKIVLIGVMTGSIKDYLATPTDPRLPGVEFHAQVADQLLRYVGGAPALGSASATTDTIWTLAAALAGWAVGWRVRAPWKVALCVIVVGAVIWWAGWLVLVRHAFISVVPPFACTCVTAFLVMGYQSLRERSDRLVMDGLVDRMMSKRIAATLWERRGELLENGHLKPQLAEATVLFSDLQGFTEISDHLDPPVLLKWLNSYFQAMSDLVEQHGGVVNKYVGDAVMAVFGPPLESVGEAAARANAQRAVECALAMRRALVGLRVTWRDRLAEQPGWTAAEAKQLGDAIAASGGELCIRIGLCSGQLVAGSLGSRDRLEYTVIGGTVNLASRLENWDKSRMGEDCAPDGCRILIEGRGRQLIDGRFITGHLGREHIKGLNEPVDIYAVLGTVPQAEAT